MKPKPAKPKTPPKAAPVLTMRDLPPPKGDEPAPVAVDFTALTDRVIALAKKRHADLQEWLKTRPQTSACKVHGYVRSIDLDYSAKLTIERTEFTVGYTACPECVFMAHSNWLKGRGVPSNMVHAAFSTFKSRTPLDAEALQVAASFMARQPLKGFLMLLGIKKGIGKTHLAISCLRLRRAGFFITQNEALRMLRKSYGHDVAFDIVERCRATPLLILDELGLSEGGRDELPMLHQILDHRYAEFKPCVITGNFDPNELDGIVGPRMADRLRECAEFALMDGESQRPKLRERYID